MSKYTWVITPNNIDHDQSAAVAQIGPSGAKNRRPLGDVIQSGEHFRLLDACGAVKFTGYIDGEYAGHEPLEDYGKERKCTDIEYDIGDRWAALDGTTREKIA